MRLPPGADPSAEIAALKAELSLTRRRDAAIDASRIGTWSWSLTDGELQLDRHCEGTLGLEPGQFTGTVASFLSIVHPEDLARVRSAIDSMGGDTASVALEYRAVSSSGRIRHIQTTARRYDDESGTGEMVIGTSRDVTFEVEVRQALEDRQRELEAANSELDDFTYIASHDLKEPLRGIHNYAGFLLEDYADRLDDEGRGMLKALSGQAERMQRLIEDLLLIARLGREPLKRRKVSVDAVVDEVLLSLNFLVEERGARIQRPSALPQVSADPVRLAEVYRNLIGNGIKYNRNDRPCITLGAEGDGIRTRLTVADNGIGIAPEHHARIFFPFKRLHARDAHGGGSGVGLTIVKKIVDAHGGRVTLVSAPGQGTTFSFTLNPEPSP